MDPSEIGKLLGERLVYIIALCIGLWYGYKWVSNKSKED